MEWPADKFYWAILGAEAAPGRRRVGGSSEQLEYRFERFLPVPLESVKTAFVRLEDGRILACAADRQEIESNVNDDVVLTPASAPHFVDADVDVRRLNLLTGDLEPGAVRRRRKAWAMEVSLLLVAIGVLLFAGAERRAQLARNESRSAAVATGAVFDAVLDEPASATQPASLLMTAELRRLRQTRESDRGEADVESASNALAALLEAWPADISAQTESVTVTGPSMTVVARVADAAAAEQLAAALAHVAGWTAQQPQIRTQRQDVRVTVRLLRDKES